jgi:hypothetical protein
LADEDSSGTEMKDLTSTSFGYLIGFMLPGVFGLYAMSAWLPGMGVLLQPVFDAKATAGPSILLLLISVGMGVCVSAARWALFEKLLFEKQCLKSDDFAKLDSGKLTLIKSLAEEHYRYHQFYGGAAIVLVVLFGAWCRKNWRCDLHTLGFTISCVALEALLVVAAHDTLCKYSNRWRKILQNAGSEK